MFGHVKHIYDIDNTSFTRILRRFIYKAQEVKGFILREDSLVFSSFLFIRNFKLSSKITQHLQFSWSVSQSLSLPWAQLFTRFIKILLVFSSSCFQVFWYLHITHLLKKEKKYCKLPLTRRSVFFSFTGPNHFVSHRFGQWLCHISSISFMVPYFLYTERCQQVESWRMMRLWQ